MAQQTFNNGDQNLDVRTILNANATDAESRIAQNESDISDNAADILALEGMTKDQVIIVKQASDLSGVLDSDKVYKLDGVIDMGVQDITVPVGGLTIKGEGNNVSGLTSSETTYTMFVDDADDAGSLTLEGLDIECTGTSSQIFDLDNSENDGIVRWMNVTFTSPQNMGELDAYRAALFDNVIVTGASNGITLSGNWASGIRIDGYVGRGGVTGLTYFDEGTSLSFASRFISNANLEIPTSGYGYNFTNTNFVNDSNFELIAGNYTGAGTPVTGILRSDTKSKWRDNNGLTNTYIGARWNLTTETATTVSSSNTYYKIAGTTTYADEQWFTNSTSNAFTYESTLTIEVVIQGTISLSAGNNDEVQVKVRQWDDSASAYIDLHEHGVVTTNGGGRGENKAILAYAEIDKDDRIELWVQNVDDTADITLLEGSLVSVSERAN